MGNYISAIKSIYQLAKLIALGFVAPKLNSPKLNGKLEETLLGGSFYQPAPAVQEEGDCADNRPTKTL